MFLCPRVTSVSWFWHCTIHHLVDLYPSPYMNNCVTDYIKIGSHPLRHVLLDRSWLCGCNIHSLCTYCTCMLFFSSFTSQVRVSSGASCLWKVALSSSCLPDLGPGDLGALWGCGGTSWGWGVSWCLGGGAEQSGTALGQVGPRCRARWWFPWAPWSPEGESDWGRSGGMGRGITKEKKRKNTFSLQTIIVHYCCLAEKLKCLSFKFPLMKGQIIGPEITYWLLSQNC